MAFFKIFSKSKINKKLSEQPHSFTSKIGKIFTQKKLDDSTIEELEDLLLISDIGVEATDEIITSLKKEKFSKSIDANEVRDFLAKYIEDILKPCQKTLNFESESKPKVIIFNGVNGSGKTTTIGKIARQLTDSNKKVVIAACDTFRAAAVDQLKVWADRANCKIIGSQKEGGDPASVAYKAFQEAKESGADVLLIDTAGRLQNKQNLMDELRKIHKVLRKIDDNEEIYENILVLDSTTGQNAKNQLQAFDDIAKVSGLIMTKLDGSAKGGILISLTKNFQKPIYAIGVGEKIEDLQEFSAHDFAQSLVGAK
jgi:fused signal recognition particle receptor